MLRLALAGIVAIIFVGTQAPASAASSETYRQLNLFGDVFERVRADYVEETEDKELIESAINGMLTALDPHSSYLDPDAHHNMEIQTQGEFGGVGIEVTMENGLVKVISPIDESPAARAGLEAGDVVTHLDGEPILGLTLNEAVDIIRGPVDSQIRFTVARPDIPEPFDVTLTRDIITIDSVRARAEGNVAYLRITSFNRNTEDALEEHMREVSGEIGGNNIEGIILDLRNNPGGLLDQAVAVSDAFLDKGEIVSTRGRKAQDSQRYNARNGDIAEGKPIIVLINGGSASASEIVAGALQDHRRAIVLGTKSFGKGSVQTIIPLSNQGAIRLTTARYYTPSGRSIQAKGIEPDIEVEQAKVSESGMPEPPSEADLRGHLEPEGEKETPPAGVEDEDADESADKPEPRPVTSTSEVAPDDYQLLYALDLLRGMSLISARSTE